MLRKILLLSRPFLIGATTTLLICLSIRHMTSVVNKSTLRVAEKKWKQSAVQAFESNGCNGDNKCQSIPDDTIINLVVVACAGTSDTTLNEALTMIKSALLFTKHWLHIHVFTTNLKEEFENAVQTWPQSMRNKFKLTVHSLRYPLEPSELRIMKDWWGPCASFRLFLPTVMADVDSVLYVDTDVIFLGAVDELWQHFYNFNDKQVGALAPRVGWDFKVTDVNPNFILMPSGKHTQVNSGVFLMNLTRMRLPSFKTDSSLSNNFFSWDRDLLLPLYKRNVEAMYGDQNLINTVFHYNPDLLYYLPCKYNYHHKFCYDSYRERFCDSAEKDGAFVIHGNANTYYNNYAPAFKAINNAMKQYNFEEDLEEFLLEKVKENLEDPCVENHSHCGNKTDLFLKTLRFYVRQKRADDNV